VARYNDRELERLQPIEAREPLAKAGMGLTNADKAVS
jgi:hypothetical protein